MKKKRLRTAVLVLLAIPAVFFMACTKPEAAPATSQSTASSSGAKSAAPPNATPSATQHAASPATSAIQTQMGMTGTIEVDLVKARVQEGILTATLVYRNTGSQAVKLQTIALDDVYFISETEKKKYHVLKDSKGDWIAAPVARSKIGKETGFGVDPIAVNAGSQTVVWFKFPAPPDSVATINLVVPDVMGFDRVPVSR